MDYLKNYSKTIKNEANSIKDFVITFLQNENNKGRTFEKAFNNLSNEFYRTYLNNNLIEKHKTRFSDIINDLRNHSYNYDSKKVDSLLKTLENEIHDKYLELVAYFKKHQIEDCKIFEDNTYENFLPEILKYSVYQKLNARLQNSIPHLTEAIKLFYEINDYQDFNASFLIDEDDKITELKIINLFKKYNQKFELKKTENILNNKKSIIAKIKSTFNEDEKTILLNLALFEKNIIDRTEKLKLIILTGELTDYSLFEGLAKNSTFYKKVSTGINHFGKKKQILLLDNIINKIESLELNATKDQLKSLKTTIIKDMQKH